MRALALTPAERKSKRAEAHHLDPVVAIGHDGVTPAVRRELDAALAAHGLVKVRVFSDDRIARALMLEGLSQALGAAPVQHIGKLLVLWRPPVERERVPSANAGAGPKIVKVLKFAKSGNHRPQVKKVKVLGNMRLAAGGTLKRATRRAQPSIKKKAAAN
ncbi:MAG: YhbY family RNA-binding protein [Pseudomonadota bacterium]|nr:YhbY family RNA-binding protein [Pseudomonadota bacterium]